LIVRDEGRSITALLNGTPVHQAFFEPGDELRIGDVSLRLGVDFESDTRGPCHPLLMGQLLAQRHLSACQHALGELEHDEPATTVGSRLFPASPEKAAAAARVLAADRKRREGLARALLVHGLGGRSSDTAQSFGERLLSARSGLPTQV
jgi:hypothetical protein